MKIQLTKAAVIDIISREDPRLLQAGRWVGDWDGDPTACTRCALGALLLGTARNFPEDDPYRVVWGAIHREKQESRSRIATSVLRFTTDDRDPPSEEELYAEAQDLITSGAPLHALSLVFEGLWALVAPDRETDPTLDDLYTIHSKVTGFIIAHFPTTIEMDIDGATPRGIPGLTVLRG